MEVERRVLVGEASTYAERLCQGRLSGRINLAFVERLNLSIRQCVSKLTRRTGGLAKFTPERTEHLEWWRHTNGERTIILFVRMKVLQKKWQGR